MSKNTHTHVSGIFLSFFLITYGCSQPFKDSIETECESYEKRRKKFTINLRPNVIHLGETSTLEVKRQKACAPEMRVFLGDLDEDFNFDGQDTLRYFQDSDSLASAIIFPESYGVKKIRGVIEEYRSITADSVHSFRYPFEIELIVIDTVAVNNNDPKQLD